MGRKENNMHFKLLSPKDLKAMEALRDSYGGGKEIARKIESLRNYEARKKIAAEKGWGKMLEKAEGYVKRFAKLEDFIEKNGIRLTKKGVCTAQVSGFQGARPTIDCIRRVSENGGVLFPTEMISVVPMTESYVYGGDLLTTLAMAENILGASKFCSTNLIGTPLPEERFARTEKVSGEKFERKSLGNGLSQVSLQKQQPSRLS
jgi:hypothetical protein